MEQVRVSIAGALAAALPASEESVPEIMPDTTRLMERVREMIRDATAKGERLSSAGERVSRAAARLQRRVESEATSVGQLAAALQLEGQPKRVGSRSGGSHLRVVEPGESAPADAADDDPARAGDAETPAGAKPQARQMHEASEPHELPEAPQPPRLRSREEGK
jgi:hypothetical protein